MQAKKFREEIQTSMKYKMLPTNLVFDIPITCNIKYKQNFTY